MKPYYEKSGITIYCGDALELLPALDDLYDAVITDPVWPNALPSLAGSEDPARLFADAAVHFPRLARRVVVQLGCDSDARFLRGVPAEMPYLRTCWLEYAVPYYKSPLLFTGDVAYVFGSPPPQIPGATVIPGRCIAPTNHRLKTGHPCGRNLTHVRWLVKWFARWTVLDPFMGAGTTALACKQMGIPFVGIEISEEFCAMAVERLRQDRLWVEDEPSVLPLARATDQTTTTQEESR